MPVRDLADLSNGVDGSAVDVADLSADDRRSAALLECGAQRCGLHAALIICGDLDNPGGTSAKEAKRSVDGAVAALAGEDAYSRRIPQAVGCQVPSRPREHLPRGHRQSGEVGHLRARAEA